MQKEWEDAVRIFRFYNDNTAIVSLLRKLYIPNEIPDLYFLADLLEGKFAKNKGRPKENNISAGLKEANVREVMINIMTDPDITLEVAVEEAAKNLPYSESFIKKKYLKNKKL
jgi:hypothetical protein